MTPTPIPDALKQALSDETLDACIDAVTEWRRGDTMIVRCASSFAEMRSVLLAAIAPHWPTPERPTWLPIETAPKDGTQVLLTDGATVSQGFWDDMWLAWDAGKNHQTFIDKLCGWMPLPPAPTPTATPR